MSLALFPAGVMNCHERNPVKEKAMTETIVESESITKAVSK